MYNGHHDVTQLIDSVGNIVATYYYDAFGNEVETTKTGGVVSADNPFRYAGYYYDEAVKLYYLNARFYDPSTARFMQEDTYRGQPHNALSLNLYTYCYNNPLIYYDPSGHAPLTDEQYRAYAKEWGISTTSGSPWKDIIDCMLGKGGFTSIQGVTINNGDAKLDYNQKTGEYKITEKDGTVRESKSTRDNVDNDSRMVQEIIFKLDLIVANSASTARFLTATPGTSNATFMALDRGGSNADYSIYDDPAKAQSIIVDIELKRLQLARTSDVWAAVMLRAQIRILNRQLEELEKKDAGYAINAWLTGYSTASDSGGRIVAIPGGDPRNYSSWYSFEGAHGINTLKGRDGLTVIELSNGAVVDENGRYWIAVGPKVLNPNYPDAGRIWDGYDGLKLGTEIDAIIRNKVTNEELCIRAIVGDLVAHTYGKGGEGIVHNGIPYPNSWNAKNEGIAPASFASIEFIRTIESTNLNQYVITGIIVYDKK